MHERTKQNEQIRQRAQGMRKVLGKKKKCGYPQKTSECNLCWKRPPWTLDHFGAELTTMGRKDWQRE
jgi:hypothetical protein